MSLTDRLEATRRQLVEGFAEEGKAPPDDEEVLRQFVYEAATNYVESHFIEIATWMAQVDGDSEPPGAVAWTDAYAAGESSAEGYQR